MPLLNEFIDSIIHKSAPSVMRHPLLVHFDNVSETIEKPMYRTNIAMRILFQLIPEGTISVETEMIGLRCYCYLREGTRRVMPPLLSLHR